MQLKIKNIILAVGLFLTVQVFFLNFSFARRIKNSGSYPYLNSQYLELRTLDGIELQGKDGHSYYIQVGILGNNRWIVRFALSDPDEAKMEKDWVTEHNDLDRFKFLGGYAMLYINNYSIEMEMVHTYPRNNKLYKQFIQLLGQIMPNNSFIWSCIIEKTTLERLKKIIHSESTERMTQKEALNLLLHTPIGHVLASAGFNQFSWDWRDNKISKGDYFLKAVKDVDGEYFAWQSGFVSSHSIKIDRRSSKELIADLEDEHVFSTALGEIFVRLLGVKGVKEQNELIPKIGEIANKISKFIQVDKIVKRGMIYIRLSIENFPCENIYINVSEGLFLGDLSLEPRGASEDIIFANRLIGDLNCEAAKYIRKLLLSIPEVQDAL